MIDSHAHLGSRDFDRDRDQVIERARTAGIELILEIFGGYLEAGSFEAGLKLIGSHDFIYGAVGVHPHDAKLYSDEWEAALLECSQKPKIIGWGEVGLDYHYDHSPREVQRAVFRRQLCLARERNLPVIIHTREAEADTLDLLRQEWPEGRPGVLHCFTGSAEFACDAVALGFCISFSGIITFKNAQWLRELARDLPAERLLIETDAPLLAPVPHRGKRNEPAYVVEVANWLAQSRGLGAQEIGRLAARNFRRVFRLPPA